MEATRRSLLGEMYRAGNSAKAIIAAAVSANATVYCIVAGLIAGGDTLPSSHMPICDRKCPIQTQAFYRRKSFHSDDLAGKRSSRDQKGNRQGGESGSRNEVVCVESPHRLVTYDFILKSTFTALPSHVAVLL